MSWKEDSRNKCKRDNTRGFKKQHYRNVSRNSKESSSSPHLQVEPQAIRGLIDVADSSDDRFSFRSNNHSWSPINSDDETNEQMRGADFELLQKSGQGISYTTFSSEKHWETEIIKQDKEKSFEQTSYFTLNLALINAGLATISFYKRMDYPSTMFDKQDIRRMNLEAEFAETKYQAVLNNYEQGIPNKPDSGKSKTSNSAKSVRNMKASENKSNNGKVENDKKDDELDELLNMTESEVSKLSIKEEGEVEVKSAGEIEEKKNETIPEEAKKDNVEEIQQWLDQVLE